MEDNNYERLNATRVSITNWIKGQAGWLILIGSSIAFVFKEALQFEKSDLDLMSMIMSMGFTYFFTFYSSISMYIMGKNTARESDSFISAMKYLAEAKKGVKDILYLLPKFTQYKNKQALEEAKKHIIERAGMVFSFYNKGYYETDKIRKTLTKEQFKALDKAKKVRITQLQPNDLTSEHKKTRGYDPLYLGKDESTDNIQKSIALLVNKATFPIITGYFAVSVVLGNNLLYGIIQVSIILTMAYKQYEGGKSYILTELKNRQIAKADFLIEFKNLFDNNSSIFTEDIEFMDGIEEGIKKETV